MCVKNPQKPPCPYQNVFSSIFLVFLVPDTSCITIEFVICGGLASGYHGVEHMTMDIDISLCFEEKLRWLSEEAEGIYKKKLDNKKLT